MMSDEQPPKGKYDWMLGEPIQHTVEVPLPPGSPGYLTTLRVEITARARIYPSRGWAIAIIVWGLLVLLLLARAHAATWEDQNAQRRAPAWGAQDPGRVTTYHPYQKPDGTVGRCAVWQWRGEPQMRCE
jgi:hypothetical protein